MENRDKLIHTAVKLFSQRGYDAVGVQEIVETAGVTKPTLYHYFGSKEGLLQAVMEAYAVPMTERIRQAAEYSGDLPQTLTKVVQAYFDIAAANPVFFRLLLGLQFSPAKSRQHQIADQVHGRQFGILETLFKTAVREHGNMRDRQQAYAASFLGMIHTYVSMALSGHVQLGDHLCHQMVKQFQHGIYS